VDLADFRAGGVRSESFFQVVGAEVMDGLIVNSYYRFGSLEIDLFVGIKGDRGVSGWRSWCRRGT
jgi:hypothetical protein